MVHEVIITGYDKPRGMGGKQLFVGPLRVTGRDDDDNVMKAITMLAVVEKYPEEVAKTKDWFDRGVTIRPFR